MNSLVEKYVLDEKETISSALNKISQNKSGIVFVINKEKKLIGAFSDGDYRKSVLENSETINIKKNLVSDFMNNSPRYVYENDKTSREALLNFFNSGLSIIPVVDAKHRITNIKDIKNAFKGIPIIERVISRAPLRCSLAGGGTDLYEFYKDHGGAIISFSISKYVNCLIEDNDNGINLYLKDIDLDLSINDKSEIKKYIKEYPKSELVLRVIDKYLKEDNIKITIWSDVKVGTGLAASTSLVVSLINGLDKRYSIQRARRLLAQEAFELERLHLNQDGGWQDQYLASYGGLNFIEFSERKGNSVRKIHLNKAQEGVLESCLMLVNTNMSHNSKNQQKKLIKSFSDDEKVNTLKTMAKRSKTLFRHLSEGNIDNLGSMLHKNWMLKKSTSDVISNKEIDKIYKNLTDFGAIGGKLLGSGSGGYFIVYVNLKDVYNFKILCNQNNYEISDIKFDKNGACAWEIS